MSHRNHLNADSWWANSQIFKNPIIGWFAFESHRISMESKDKKLFIGMDEAGYGPNLGPLVIASSVWEAPAEMQESQLESLFQECFRPSPWTAGCEHVPLGDSKKLYQPGKGLASLESGLLSMIHYEGFCHDDFASFLKTHASFPERSSMPWYQQLDELALPTAADPAEILRLAEIGATTLTEQGVRLLATRASVISESYFNSEVDRLGSKGQLLSQQTLGEVAKLLDAHPGNAEIFCDRQGGRKNYMPILLDALPDEWFVETSSGAQRCSYRNQAPRSIEVHFSVGGDQFPPTALASMLAKYLRERLMQPFNEFWRKQLPDLKPTAGYPEDAKRFRALIEPIATTLGLSTENWWRCR